MTARTDALLRDSRRVDLRSPQRRPVRHRRRRRRALRARVPRSLIDSPGAGHPDRCRCGRGSSASGVAVPGQGAQQPDRHAGEQPLDRVGEHDPRRQPAAQQQRAERRRDEREPSSIRRTAGRPRTRAGPRPRSVPSRARTAARARRRHRRSAAPASTRQPFRHGQFRDRAARLPRQGVVTIPLHSVPGESAREAGEHGHRTVRCAEHGPPAMVERRRCQRFRVTAPLRHARKLHRTHPQGARLRRRDRIAARGRAAPVAPPRQPRAVQARGPAAGLLVQAARRLQQDRAPVARRSRGAA